MEVADSVGYAHANQEMRDEDLIDVYKLMLLTRIFDTQAVILQRQGRIGFFVPSEGEEAAEVGSAYALKKEDWAFTDYRSSGVLITRGMPLTTLFAQLMANAEDLLKGRAMPSHWGSRAINVVPPSSPLCTQLPHAVGVALGATMSGEKIATIAYFGDGGTSSNDFHSGMNFAGVFRTPTVFFCRNNGYAISIPVSRQTATASLAVKGSAYNVESVQVDGNDVVAVYSATKRALEKARNGGGPTFIEAVTYRLGPHSTSDDPARYRDVKEVEAMRFKDPVKRFRAFLEQMGVWNDEEQSRAENSILKQVKNAISSAEKIPQPDVRTLFEDVYSEITWNLKRESEDLLAEIGGN